MSGVMWRDLVVYNIGFTGGTVAAELYDAGVVSFWTRLLIIVAFAMTAFLIAAIWRRA